MSSFFCQYLVTAVTWYEQRHAVRLHYLDQADIGIGERNGAKEHEQEDGMCYRSSSWRCSFRSLCNYSDV